MNCHYSLLRRKFFFFLFLSFISVSNTSVCERKWWISLRSSATASGLPWIASSSIIYKQFKINIIQQIQRQRWWSHTLCFILVFSSFNVCNCLFHSSTLAVDSCRAFVNLVLLLFNVCSSISHFLALVELKKKYILKMFQK